MNLHEKNNKKHNDHQKKVKRIVGQIMENEITNMPFDYLFRRNINKYPETNHKLLGLPGEFKNKENTSVFVNEKAALEMDYLESVLPDGDLITREASINVEHETGILKVEKGHSIFEYCLNTTIMLKKLCYPYIVTNYDYNSDILFYFIEGIILIIRLIIFNEKKVYETLNTLNEKDYSKEEFSIEDYVLFTYCMVFAKKPYAQDVIENLARLFKSIGNINNDLKKDLHSSLCLMIKYHFEDKTQIEELITMITNEMQEEELDELPFNEQMKIDLAKSEEKYLKSEKERLKIISELNKKENEIAEKDKKIAKLQKILLKNNIII
jgi:hypothetical protein